MVRSKIKLNKWFWIGLASTVMLAPNATVIKIGLKNIDPAYFNFLRFSIVSFLMFPWVIKDFKLVNRRNIKYALIVGFLLWIAITVFTQAIKMSSASYAALIILINPLFLILYSIKLNGEQVSKRAMTGISLAALGAFLIIFLPIAVAQNSELHFYPLATLLLMINCCTYPLSSIIWKKAHESGLSLYFILGFSSIVIAALSLINLVMFPPASFQIHKSSLLAILFSSLFVAIVGRLISIKIYERLGSVFASALGYLETFLAILIPVIILGEKLSVAMVAGGALILLGIYIIEYHKSRHHKYFHIFRHH